MFIAPHPFFEPTAAFILWMASRYSEQPIVDCGCGYGNFVEALRMGGCEGTVGMDLLDEKLEEVHTRYPGAVGRVFYGDTRVHPAMLLEEAVVVFARPCHDASWIAETVAHASATAHTFLYISKPGSEVSDLAGFERRRVAWDIVIGEEGELCWEFRAVPRNAPNELARWCLVEFKEHGLVWARDGGDVWLWGWGPSHCTKGGDPIITEAVITDAWLDWSATSAWKRWDKRVNDESLDNGWIDPAGRLYRCAYWEHNGIVYDYLHKEARELEDGGWCKLQRGGASSDRHLFIMGNRSPGKDHTLTEPQVKTLLAAGFVPPLYMLDEAEGDWSALCNRLEAEEGELSLEDLTSP